METRKVVIQCHGQPYSFKVRIHQSKSKNRRLLEPEFYLKNGGVIHKGVHHEIELLESPIWGRLETDLDLPIHIHQNPLTKKFFVCFNGKLSTVQEAIAILHVWCLGTVYSLIYKEDFGVLASMHQSKFLATMRDEYGIVILEDYVIHK